MKEQPNSNYLGGVNPVIEALTAHSRPLEAIYIQTGRTGPQVEKIKSLARRRSVKVSVRPKEFLDRLLPATNHQGVAALAAVYTYAAFEDIVSLGRDAESALVLMLDQVQDPMNLGSLMRTAETAGALGLVAPKDRACPVSPAVLRASAGAAEYVRLAQVVNLVRAMEELKEAGFWVIGLEAGQGQSLYAVNLKGKIALVVGGEGKGIRPLVAKGCDLVASIPMKGRVNSLNASVAAAVAVYEYLRQNEA